MWDIGSASPSDSCGRAGGGTGAASCCAGAVLATLWEVEAAGSGTERVSSSHGEPSEEAPTVLACVVRAPELLSRGTVPPPGDTF